MGAIEDVAAETCAVGIALDDRILCTIFIDAQPTEYEAKANNLVSRDDRLRKIMNASASRNGKRKKG